MNPGKTLKFLIALLLINTRSAISLRGAFILTSTMMFINNLIFFVVWLIIYQRVDNIRGWVLADCTLMYGIVAFAFGLFAIIFGGTLNLARIISEGELDTYMSFPENVLISATASRSNVAGWGDVASGVVLIALSGHMSFNTLPLIAVCIICSTLLYTATGIIIHSTAFFMGPVNTLARQMHEFVLAFSLYPGTIYTGALKVILFTLIPAGFISYLPVELVKSFSLAELLYIFSAVAAYVFLAVFLFGLGLKHYESGNRTIVRA